MESHHNQVEIAMAIGTHTGILDLINNGVLTDYLTVEQTLPQVLIAFLLQHAMVQIKNQESVALALLVLQEMANSPKPSQLKLKQLMKTLNQFYGMINGKPITHILRHFQSATELEEL